MSKEGHQRRSCDVELALLRLSSVFLTRLSPFLTFALSGNLQRLCRSLRGTTSLSPFPGPRAPSTGSLSTSSVQPRDRTDPGWTRFRWREASWNRHPGSGSCRRTGRGWEVEGELLNLEEDHTRASKLSCSGSPSCFRRSYTCSPRSRYRQYLPTPVSFQSRVSARSHTAEMSSCCIADLRWIPLRSFISSSPFNQSLDSKALCTSLPDSKSTIVSPSEDIRTFFELLLAVIVGERSPFRLDFSSFANSRVTRLALLQKPSPSTSPFSYLHWYCSRCEASFVLVYPLSLDRSLPNPTRRKQ